MLLDKIDLMIMEELEDDARQPISALAKKLGLKRTTVNYRLKRLTAKGVVTIACVGNPELLGYQFLLVIGINVSPGKAEVAANQLVTLPAIKVVSLAGGRFNILAWVLLRDPQALRDFLSEDMGNISDITAIEIMHCYHWVRDVWKHFKPQTETTVRHLPDTPSDLDLSILEAMQKNPRQTIRALAKSIRCSVSVAKARLEKLVDEETIRFVCAVDPRALGYDNTVVILIKTHPDKVHAVAGELSLVNTAMFVSLITGHWQVLFGAQFRDSEHMHNFLSERLISIPGITEFEVVHLVKTMKYSLRIQESA